MSTTPCWLSIQSEENHTSWPDRSPRCSLSAGLLTGGRNCYSGELSISQEQRRTQVDFLVPCTTVTAFSAYIFPIYTHTTNCKRKRERRSGGASLAPPACTPCAPRPWKHAAPHTPGHAAQPAAALATTRTRRTPWPRYNDALGRI